MMTLKGELEIHHVVIMDLHKTRQAGKKITTIRLVPPLRKLHAFIIWYTN